MKILGQEVEVKSINNMTYFKASDVAKALKYRDSFNMTRKVTLDSIFKENDMLYIDRSGLVQSVAGANKITSEEKKHIFEVLGVPVLNFEKYSSKEQKFVEALKEVLKPFNVTVTQQFFVKGRRVDIYIPEWNLVIEYDELKHKYYTFLDEELRQQIIEDELGCRFIRVSEANSDLENVGIVLRTVMLN